MSSARQRVFTACAQALQRCSGAGASWGCRALGAQGSGASGTITATATSSSAGARPAPGWCTRLARGFATQGPVTHTPSRRAPAAAAAAAAARGGAPAAAAASASAAAAAAAKPPGGFGRWLQAFRTVPTVPKWLGLSGAIPFLALAPPVCKHLTGLLPADVVDNSAMIQVCYGVVIVTFLGAVHWGVAMASPLAGSPLGARIANEAYVYSVIPSLVAWPVALMEPGAGSIVMSLLLPACYLADYTRRNLGLPAWYMALRAPLTLLATFGLLLTATRQMHLELDRVKGVAAGEQAAAAAGGSDEA